MNLRDNFEKSVDLSKFIARHYLIEESGVIFFKSRNEDIYFTKKMAHAKLPLLDNVPKFKIILNYKDAYIVNLSNPELH